MGKVAFKPTRHEEESDRELIERFVARGSDGSRLSEDQPRFERGVDPIFTRFVQQCTPRLDEPSDGEVCDAITISVIRRFVEHTADPNGDADAR